MPRDVRSSRTLSVIICCGTMRVSANSPRRSSSLNSSTSKYRECIVDRCLNYSYITKLPIRTPYLIVQSLRVTSYFVALTFFRWLQYLSAVLVIIRWDSYSYFFSPTNLLLYVSVNPIDSNMVFVVFHRFRNCSFIEYLEYIYCTVIIGLCSLIESLRLFRIFVYRLQYTACIAYSVYVLNLHRRLLETERYRVFNFWLISLSLPRCLGASVFFSLFIRISPTWVAATNTIRILTAFHSSKSRFFADVPTSSLRLSTPSPLGGGECSTVQYVPSPHGTRCRFHTRSIPRSRISMYRFIHRLFSRSSLSVYFSPDHRIKIISSATTEYSNCYMGHFLFNALCKS